MNSHFKDFILKIVNLKGVKTTSFFFDRLRGTERKIDNNSISAADVMIELRHAIGREGSLEKSLDSSDWKTIEKEIEKYKLKN